MTPRAIAAALAVAAGCGAGDPGGADAASCARTPGAPTAVGTIAGIGSRELSGLAASRTIAGLLWTHGDGGDPDIYSIDSATAAVRGTLHLTGAGKVDWEDIATAPCAAGHCIYVADTGDNDLERTSVAILEVAEPATAPIGAIEAAFTRYELRYPDGPHDVEALIVDPRDGASYGIAKVAAGRAGVYALPRVAGAIAAATRIGELAIPSGDPRVTAADMAVDACGARILVRSRDALYELRGTATASVAALLGAPLAAMPVASEPQGESAAYTADGAAYFTTSEGADPTLSVVALR